MPASRSRRNAQRAQNTEVGKLRAEVLKKHRAATSKISRLRNVKGVEIGGTKNDPRRDVKRVKAYNTSQLNNYLADLNNFTSRSTNFTPSVGGALSLTRVKYFERLQNKFNDIGAKHHEQVSHTTGKNVGSIKIKPLDNDPAKKKNRMSKGGGEMPYTPSNLNPKHMNGPEALEKFIKQFERKTSRTYNNEEIAKSRKSVDKMIDEIGDNGLKELFDSLSDHQFDIIWNYMDFAGEIVPHYVRAQMQHAGQSQDDLVSATMGDDRNDGKLDALKDALKWAKTLPEKPQGSRGSKTN